MRKRKSKGLIFKLILLGIIFYAIYNHTNVLAFLKPFNGKEAISENLEIYDYKNDKVMGKYSESEFKTILKNAKYKFKYREDLDLDIQLDALSEFIPEAKDLKDKRQAIPDDVISTSLKYPENFLWTYNYDRPVEKKVVVTKAEKSMKVPYYMQTDSRWGYKKIGNSSLGYVGCGPTSFSMVVSALTKDYSLTPDKLMDYALESGHYKEDVGTLWSFMTAAADHYSIKSEEIPLDRNVIYNKLEDNSLIIASVSKGDFTYAGHFIVLVGIEDGKIRVFDPNSWVNSELTWSYERLSEQIKNIWSFSK